MAFIGSGAGRQPGRSRFERGGQISTCRQCAEDLVADGFDAGYGRFALADRRHAGEFSVDQKFPVRADLDGFAIRKQQLDVPLRIGDQYLTFRERIAGLQFDKPACGIAQEGLAFDDHDGLGGLRSHVTGFCSHDLLHT